MMHLYFDNIENNHLSTTTAVLTTRYATQIITELPSGVIADVYLGRRMTLILATACRFVAFATISLESVARLETLILSAIFSGAANAMVSGTKDALLYESLQKMSLESEFNHYVSTASLMWPVGSALSGVLGSAIVTYTGDARDTFIVSMMPLTLALIASFFISETSQQFINQKKKKKKRQMSILSTSIHLLKSRKLSLLVVFVMGNFAFYETILQFRGVFLEHNGVNETDIGIWDSARFVLSSLGTLLAPRLVSSGRISGRVTVLACVCTACISIVLASSYTQQHTTTFFLLAAFAWGVQWPLEKTLINDAVPSSSRATAISILSLLKKAGASVVIALVSETVDRTSNINLAFSMLGSIAVVVNAIPLLLIA
eukprot:g4138.t1